MTDAPRKKSPRAPAVGLDVALEKALRLYEKENRHPVNIDIAAGDIGYKDAKGGAAMTMLASLRYFGLVDRPKEGFLSVSKEVEAYKFAPSQEHRLQIALGWLKAPTVFAELLAKYGAGLPSDATIRFDLIQMGFLPGGAETCVEAFKRSINFIGIDKINPVTKNAEMEIEAYAVNDEPIDVAHATKPNTSRDQATKQQAPIASSEDFDRIPVRLPGSRKAWIEIPSPFYEADKARMKAQIDLLLTEEEGEEE